MCHFFLTSHQILRFSESLDRLAILNTKFRDNYSTPTLKNATFKNNCIMQHFFVALCNIRKYCCDINIKN